MKKIYSASLLISFLSILTSNLLAQDKVQSIRGRILDAESHYPITAATIKVFQDTNFIVGTVSDYDGYFMIADVPIGRYTLYFEYLGYEKIVMPNTIVGSGKETILNIEMTEAVKVLDGAVVSEGGGFETVNDAGVVSNRNFDAGETERYVGSRQDPARMALNFAGAQGSDDSRNDIIVRGNSPLGILWRYEDVELFNPNHFAVAGSTGGPISMLNNKVIGRSDFMTGAFPAGFGNALSGVFDLRMRNGNNQKHERTFQFGLFGTELALEGPLSKKTKASYLVAYRYSTLKIFESINFSLGTSAVPNYQDLTFKVNLPTKKAGTFSFFGIGGTSKIDIVMSSFTEPQEELYGKKNRDQYFRTSMGMVGLSHKYHINKTTLSKITLSTSVSDIGSTHNYFTRNQDFTVNAMIPLLYYKMIESKTSLAWSLRKKVNIKHSFVTGFYADAFKFNYRDSIYNLFSSSWENRMDYKGSENAILIQPFIQWSYKASNRLNLTGGLHSQYFALNNSFALEPRAGAKYALGTKSSLSVGYGLHSRLQPFYVYFYQKQNSNGELYKHNKDMGFTRSHHFVTSYDHSFTKHFRMKAEVYYQYLFDVPVESNRISSFSLLNMGSGFDRFFPDELANTGTGENYGVELTLERSFYKNYFILATGSLFESTFKGSDGIKRNTDFNGNFASRVMIGGEKPVGKKKTTSLNFGAGVTYAGGRRYSPVDIDSSLKSADVVFRDDERNTLQFKDFFRADLRIGFKVEAKKITHEFVLDIINVFNTRNILTLTYDPDIAATNPGVSPLREEPQLGRLPVFFYKIHF